MESSSEILLRTQAPGVEPLPHVITAGTPDSIVDAGMRTRVRPALFKYGAVLLRGFPIDDVSRFEDVVRTVSGEPLNYMERSSPRSTIKGNVYTSTDYPPSEEIFLHNESSYQLSWPMTLSFYCVRPPTTLGATPLADTRRIYEAIDPAVREEFAAKGWLLVRNFHDGLGVSWQETFNTDNKDEVARYAAQRGLEIEWYGAGNLRTKARRRAIHRHPVTDELVWFNHITFFHISTLPSDVGAGLRAMFAETELPTNTYFGDGSPIPDDVMDHLRACYQAEKRRFDWQIGDVLIVDNMLSSHSRESFTGPRKIAVAMAEPHTPAGS